MTDWWLDQNLKKMVYDEAEKGNGAIQCELAAKLMEEGMIQESLYWYKRAAGSGVRDAMFNLGTLYLDGRPGLMPDAGQAYFWFLEAARHGDAEGMYMAGRFLLNGYGCEKDEEQAVSYLENAAKAGFSPAAEILLSLPGRAEERAAKSEIIEELAKKADFYLGQEDYEAAIAPLSEAIEKSTAFFGETDSCTTGLLSNLAFVYTRLGKYDESIPIREKIVTILREALSVSHPRYITAAMSLSADYGRVGKLQSALMLSKKAYRTTEHSVPYMDETRALCVNRYAADLMAAGKFGEASTVLNENLRAVEELRKNSPDGKFSGEGTLLESRLKRTQALAGHLEELKKEHEVFFSLPEHRRTYAWVCAELMEMLDSLPPDYLEKIDGAELSHYREQAELATCYEKHSGIGDGVESDPYTDALQALLSFKYLMPGLASCAEECRIARVKAQITWVKNELSLILTILPKKSYVDRMEHAQPVDFLKSLNALTDGSRVSPAVVSLTDVSLSVREEAGRALITFRYETEGARRQITLAYDEKTTDLTAPEGFVEI